MNPDGSWNPWPVDKDRVIEDERETHGVPEKLQATQTQREKRLSICETCEFRKKLFGATKYHYCQKCGCVIDLKVLFKWAVCPIGKW